MFNFFSDVKIRLTALEKKVEAIFAHIHTEFAAKVVEATAVESDVKTDVENDVATVAAAPATAVADVANDVAGTVAADVTKAL